MYNSFTLWVGLSRSTLQNACKAGKDPQMPKFHSFLLLSLINWFGKENSQFTKNIRETKNWSYQKLFCMILSNFCFLCFLVWVGIFRMARPWWRHRCHVVCLDQWKVEGFPSGIAPRPPPTSPSPAAWTWLVPSLRMRKQSTNEKAHLTVIQWFKRKSLKGKPPNAQSD